MSSLREIKNSKSYREWFLAESQQPKADGPPFNVQNLKPFSTIGSGSYSICACLVHSGWEAFRHRDSSSSHILSPFCSGRNSDLPGTYFRRSRSSSVLRDSRSCPRAWSRESNLPPG